MSEPEDLSKALLAEGEPRPLNHALQEVRNMITKQESLARFWTRLCLFLWAAAFILAGFSAFASGPMILLIMPFTIAMAVLSTIRLLFVIRSGNVNRMHELLLELRAEVEELKAK